MEAPATPPGRSRVWGAAGDVCGERARSFAPTPLPSPVPFVNGPANVFGPESGPNPVPTRQAAFCCGLVVRSRRGSHPFTLSKALTPTPVATTTLLSAGQGRSCGPRDTKCETKLRFLLARGPTLGLHPPPPPPPCVHRRGPLWCGIWEALRSPPQRGPAAARWGGARAQQRGHTPPMDGACLASPPPPPPVAVGPPPLPPPSCSVAAVGQTLGRWHYHSCRLVLRCACECVSLCGGATAGGVRTRAVLAGVGDSSFCAFDQRGGWPGRRLRVGDVLTCTAEATPTTWCVRTSARCCLPVVGRG